MRFLLVFLVLLFISPKHVLAKETYFNYSSSYQLDSEGNLDITLYYDIIGAEDTRFRIKPNTEKNIPVKIYYEGIEYLPKTWEEMPILSESLKIKFLDTSFDITKLWFEIQDTKTAKIYETPKKLVRSKNWFYEYLSLLKYSNEDDP